MPFSQTNTSWLAGVSPCPGCVFERNVIGHHVPRYGISLFALRPSSFTLLLLRPFSSPFAVRPSPAPLRGPRIPRAVESARVPLRRGQVEHFRAFSIAGARACALAVGGVAPKALQGRLIPVLIQAAPRDVHEELRVLCHGSSSASLRGERRRPTLGF